MHTVSTFISDKKKDKTGRCERRGRVTQRGKERDRGESYKKKAIEKI